MTSERDRFHWFTTGIACGKILKKERFRLEFPVYSRLSRSYYSAAVMLIPPLIIMLVSPRGGRATDELWILLGIMIPAALILFLVLHLSMNVWVKFDSSSRKFTFTRRLVGLSVWRKDYDISQFDRISLHRGFRGGYCASLVGRDLVLTLSVSNKLEEVRKIADLAVAQTNLKLNDQI